MSEGQEHETGDPLVEREAELLTLRGAVERALLSRGSVVVVRGQAGIGKSRLLTATAAIAADRAVRVLSARGGVLERDLAYGALRLLLDAPLAALGPAERAEVLGGAAALAAPALAVAAGDGGAGELDRGLAVEHGLYWTVANLAERQPLLLVLDDVHWFDAPSLRFLVYLARRLADLPVAMVVATRPDERAEESLLVDQLLEEPGVEELRPSALSVAGVGALLEARMGDDVAPEFAASCHDVVNGNPFLLSQLVVALVADGVPPTVRGVLHLKEVRAPTVARATLLRLARMPVGATGLATAVAVLGDGVSLDQAAALADLDAPTAAVAADRLVVEGLMTSAVPLGFAHPIVREAVYGELGPAERGRWHARAAELLGAAGAGDERIAAHLLPTVATGSETSAATLRRAALRALERGAPDIAARYLARALAEPPPPEERGATALALGTAGFLAGAPVSEVEQHLRHALRLVREPVARRDAWLLLSRTSAMDTSIPGAVAILDEALIDLAGSAPELLAPLMHERCGQGITHPETFASSIDLMAEPPATAQSPADRLALCHHANRRCFAGTSARATEDLAIAALADGRLVHDLGPESTTLHQLAYALATTDRHDLALSFLGAALTASQDRGSAFGIAGALGTRSITHFLRGDLAEAEADGYQALGVPGVPSFVVPAISAFTCLALVERGALDDADALLVAAGCGPRLPEVTHMHYAFWARGRLRLAQGRLEEARADLAEFGRRSERVELLTPVVPWRADSALLHARLGLLDDAARLAGEYDELARGWGTPRVLGVSARTRGLLAGGEPGLALLREAVEAHAGSPARLEHAYSLAELGAALRRAGRRTEAVDVLRSAGETAEHCGAGALVSRIREELVVAGVGGRQFAVAGVDALTPSELRVARMAASGGTNKQIAETLYVTAKTVENHLGRVYLKLGITSRADLPVALDGAG
ncbi:LuxR family transcriptional regulator [Nocardioides endophyticus]|uniref:LuxR family transcriptional regulator n=1 Tax=Nocardioides endophyticus TaxID=1353775 RepID=A0ABP8ZC26_9ACTN